MIAILILGVMFLGLFLVAALRLATTRRARTVERLTAIQEYGFSADAIPQVLLPQTAASGVTAFVSSLGEAVSQRFGGIREDVLRAELMAAGIYTMSPRTLLGYRVIAAVLFPIVVLIVASVSVLSVLVAIVTIAIGWMLPLVIVRRKARIRLSEIDRRLPDLIDILVVTIEAGLGFTGALRVAADNVTGPLSDELRLTLQEQTMGLSVGEALGHLAARANTPGMLSFVRAMAQGERLGISVGQIMRNLSLEMRKRRRKQADERAQKAPIKMLFPLVFLIFPAMFVVLLVPALISLVQTLGSGKI
jgi:tight adherence protein C